MTTALSLYNLAAASTTLPTARELAPVGGATGTTSASNTVGTATGWGELWSTTDTSAWPALASVGAPSGHGMLWDVTTLESQQIVAGNWSQQVRLHCGQGTGIVADILARWYIHHTDGSYTTLGSSTLTAQTIAAWFNPVLPLTALAASPIFSAGDKLYSDLWLRITANNTALSTATVDQGDFGTTPTGTGGGSNILTTPGYVARVYDAGISAGVGGTRASSALWTPALSVGVGGGQARLSTLRTPPPAGVSVAVGSSAAGVSVTVSGAPSGVTITTQE